MHAHMKCWQITVLACCAGHTCCKLVPGCREAVLQPVTFDVLHIYVDGFWYCAACFTIMNEHNLLTNEPAVDCVVGMQLGHSHDRHCWSEERCLQVQTGVAVHGMVRHVFWHM